MPSCRPAGSSFRADFEAAISRGWEITPYRELGKKQKSGRLGMIKRTADCLSGGNYDAALADLGGMADFAGKIKDLWELSAGKNDKVRTQRPQRLRSAHTHAGSYRRAYTTYALTQKNVPRRENSASTLPRSSYPNGRAPICASKVTLSALTPQRMPQKQSRNDSF